MHSPLARAIREARLAVRLTQEQLGRQLGVKGRAVYRWERADSTPKRALRPLLIGAILLRSEQAAAKLASAFEQHVARTKGFSLPAPPPLPAQPLDPVALELALFAMAEELDLGPRRLRAALTRLLGRAAQAGYTLDAARRSIERRLGSEPTAASARGDAGGHAPAGSQMRPKLSDPP